jgi:hypothetical protein
MELSSASTLLFSADDLGATCWVRSLPRFFSQTALIGRHTHPHRSDMEAP